MAALIAERKTPKLGQDVLPSFPTNAGIGLAANAKIFAGGIVASNAAGNAVAGSTALGLTVLGVAEKTVDNTGGIAGALSIVPRQGVFGFNNSSAGDAIGAANVGQLCYLVDDNTVALTNGSGTRSPAGTIVAVDATSPGQGQPAEVFVLLGVTGQAPLIQAGTVTLVAGTKTIAAGITLSASSVITFSRKTQGGTITSTVGYEAPGASRTIGAPGTAAMIVNAVVAAGTVASGDTSTLDYLIVG
jgi:hypothetical protein